MPRCRSLLVLLFLPLLGSCSYVYELLAITINGQVAFAVDPASGFQPDCVHSIDVSADDGEPKAKSEPGDDKGLVENGSVYWWDFRDVRSCKNEFPIIYGDALIGPRADGTGYVKAKPLKQGVVYQVGTSGDGAYGSGWFKILPNGEIENYPNDPTPADRDEDGYLIKSEPDTGAN